LTDLPVGQTYRHTDGRAISHSALCIAYMPPRSKYWLTLQHDNTTKDRRNFYFVTVYMQQHSSLSSLPCCWCWCAPVAHSINLIIDNTVIIDAA